MPPIGERWRGLARERVRAMREIRLREIFADATESGAEDFEIFLDEFSPTEAPSTFHFVHVLLPHSPWRWMPSGRAYETSFEIEGVDESGRWVNDPTQVWQGYQRHLLQLGYTDKVLGRVLNRMQSRGLFDKALVVVAADHGISFIPGQPRRRANRWNLADIARVPLFIKLPGQRHGRIVMRSARTIDILPTVADVLNVQIPWVVDGRSLLDPTDAEEDVVLLQDDGTIVEASSAAIDRGLRHTLRRKDALFGDGTDSLYRIGAHVRLLGAAVNRQTQATAARVHFDDPEQFVDVDLSSRFAPLRVTGTIEAGDIRGRPELAVVVNGKVAALTRWYNDNGVRRFSALLPEATLTDGENRVEVYAILVKGKQTDLARIGRGQPVQARGEAVGEPATGLER